jgi:hypothetical protein
MISFSIVFPALIAWRAVSILRRRLKRAGKSSGQRHCRVVWQSEQLTPEKDGASPAGAWS